MVVRKSVAALTQVVAALTAHPSLRVLRLTLAENTLDNLDRNLERDDAVMRALCNLVEADAPSLRELDFTGILHDGMPSPLYGTFEVQ